eukprot:CFRG1671T1
MSKRASDRVVERRIYLDKGDENAIFKTGNSQNKRVDIEKSRTRANTVVLADRVQRTENQVVLKYNTGLCDMNRERKGPCLASSTSATADLSNVKTIKFERVSKLGQGGFAKVYKVRCVESGKIFALKKLRGRLTKTSESGLMEQKAMSQCQATNVLQCYTTFVMRGSVFMLLECLDMDLSDLIREHTKGLPHAVVRHIVRGILNGVSAIHDESIIHRDIKPANILLATTGAKVKITDFSLACSTDIIAGKPRSPQVFNLPYRAPELCLGSKTYKTEVDIWAVGCMLAEMVLGQKLFKEAPSDLAHLNNIFSIISPPPPTAWKGTLGQYMNFDEIESVGMASALGQATCDSLGISGVEVLKGMLNCVPQGRISALNALESVYLSDSKAVSSMISDSMTMSTTVGDLRNKLNHEKLTAKTYECEATVNVLAGFLYGRIMSNLTKKRSVAIPNVVLHTKEFSVCSLGKCTFDSPLDAVQWYDDDDGVVQTSTLDMDILNNNITFVEKAGPRQKLFFDPANTRVAVITCGGLCPGLNNVIRAIVMCLWHRYGVRHISGFKYGYEGLNPETSCEIPLNPEVVGDIHHFGGTLLGSSRGGQPVPVMVDFLLEKKIDILFTLGGDGTQKGANAISQECEKRNVPIACIGVPKTIDNDLAFVERTFGFVTAVELAQASIQAAHEEARGARNGIGIVKLMGRDSGFIAMHASLANCDTNLCLLPEVPFTIEKIVEYLEARFKKRGHCVIVVAEGAGQDNFKVGETDASGNVKYGDIGILLRDKLKESLCKKGILNTIKYIDPSYSIRSAPTNASDSLFCVQLAQMACHAAMAGKTRLIVGMLNSQFVHIPIEKCVSTRKKVLLNGSTFQSLLDNTGMPAHWE